MTMTWKWVRGKKLWEEKFTQNENEWSKRHRHVSDVDM
jgi:hypothetical protein